MCEIRYLNLFYSHRSSYDFEIVDFKYLLESAEKVIHFKRSVSDFKTCLTEANISNTLGILSSFDELIYDQHVLHENYKLIKFWRPFAYIQFFAA